MDVVKQVEMKWQQGARELEREGERQFSSSLELPSSEELLYQRWATYRLIGALFLYPNQKRLAALHSTAIELKQQGDLWETPSIATPLRRVLTLLAEASEETASSIEEEYLRLFQVKPAAPPYESYYLDPEGQARAQIAGQLERTYAEAGLALSPTLHDLPDHLAVELEFVSFLCVKEEQARNTDVNMDAIPARQLQRDFLSQHLGRWFPHFARQAKKAEPRCLYGDVVDAAYAFIYQELKFLNHKPTARTQ